MGYNHPKGPEKNPCVSLVSLNYLESKRKIRVWVWKDFKKKSQLY